jgi:hypothetical protein
VNRRFIPLALLAVLTVGTGLGAGLGLASGPATYSPPLSGSQLATVTAICLRSTSKSFDCTVGHSRYSFYFRDNLPTHFDIRCIDKWITTRLTASHPDEPGVAPFFNPSGKCGLPG